MKSILILPFFIFLEGSTIAQTKATEEIVELHQKMKQHLDSGLLFLENRQKQETISGRHYKGEWPSFMGLKRRFVLLGKDDPVYDSNCYSVAQIHNSLANIYLKYPEYKRILPMLELSFQRILGYRNGQLFNFWNLLPPLKKLHRSDSLWPNELVRRPTNFRLKSKYINKAANVAEDADDTALAYMALALRKKIDSSNIEYTELFSPSVSILFDVYRDTGRKNRHWYNYLYGNDHNTGAYLTWLTKEHEFKHWNIITVIGHNATFFLPFSECYPHAYVPYLPYGSNDLDAVVNSNVLSSIAMNGEIEIAQGVAHTIAYIEHKASSKKYDRVATYYPNRYQFPYAASKAYAEGISSLTRSMRYFTEYLTQTQNEDGSWFARKRVNKKDALQSTAYALNALINIGDYEANNTIPAIHNALKYLFAHAIHNENGSHWQGGVYFTGGTVVRNTLYWKSNAYTTAIIIEAFANYSKYLELAYDLK